MIWKYTDRTLYVFLLAGPALALGAVHPGALCFFLALSGFLLWRALVLKKGYLTLKVDLPTVIFAGLIAITLLQLVPLPSGLVKWIASETYQVRARALAPMQMSAPAFMPLTLDVSLTLFEAARLLLILATYWISVLWCKRHGTKFVMYTLIGLGVATAAVFIGHRITFADTVYGWYSPKYVTWLSGEAVAPLINPNHLAALLGLSTALCIGKILEVRHKSDRILLIVMASLLGGALILTLSRGGIASFLAGQLVFFSLKALQKRRHQYKDKILAWLPLSTLGVLGVGFFAAQDLLVDEFAGGDLTKLEVFKESLPLVGKFFALGAGKGTFGLAFPLVSDLSFRATFTHAENTILQLLVDYGVVVGTLALLAGLLVFVKIVRLEIAKPKNAATVAALSAFGLHNLVDFNMEIAGVAIPAVALLAINTSRRSYRLKRKWHFNKPVSWAVVGAILLLCGVSIAYLPQYYLDVERHQLEDALGHNDKQPFESHAIEQSLTRHPADWYVPYAMGVHVFTHQNQNPLPWLSRALSLNGAAAPAHFYVGRYLLKMGRLDQALLEFRLAGLLNPTFRRSSAKILVEAVPSFESLSQIATFPEDQKELWPSIATAFSIAGLHKEAMHADKAILKLRPDHAPSLRRLGQNALRTQQFEEALEFGQKLKVMDGHYVGGVVIEARALIALKSHEKAQILLEKTNKTHPLNRSIIMSLTKLYVQMNEHKKARDTADLLLKTSKSRNEQLQTLIYVGNIRASTGYLNGALVMFQKARRIEPQNANILIRIADIGERVGDYSKAQEAIRALIKLQPNEAKWKNRLIKVQRKQQSTNRP